MVGAGNSGAEIALEVASRHPTWLAGKESGHVPFRVEGAPARYDYQPLLFRVVGHRMLTVETPIGRRMRPRLTSHAAPLVRVSKMTSPPPGWGASPGSWGCATAGPCWPTSGSWRLADVVWCTGSGPDFSWIDLPVFGDSEDEPMHHREAVATQPGLYVVGLHFLYAMSSGFLPGVDRDAEYVVDSILRGALVAATATSRRCSSTQLTSGPGRRARKAAMAWRSSSGW